MTGGNSRMQNQASTILMVFILSTAFLFGNFGSTENANPADDADLSVPTKMPSTGT